jgi:hypothetical protein
MSEYKLWKPASKSLARDYDLIERVAADLAAKRNADSTSTSPIVAQRLEPEVMPVFVDHFPVYELIEKVPSNGLSHTFLQQTAFSGTTAPHTIGETGTVADDSNTYLRKTTNIMQVALRRGVTIKAGLAGAAAGGASSDLMGREIAGGLQTIARDCQNEFLSYQESDSGSTTTNAANGKYDVNGVNGLRYILNNNAPPENNAIVDIRTSGWTDQRVLRAVRNVCNAITDKGGRPDLIIASTRGSEASFEDQMQFTRYLKEATRMEIAPGMTVRAISTDAGDLPVVIVPGSTGVGLGSWVDGSTFTYVDLFIVQTDTLEIPYLGAPEPTVLRIPIGTDGQLRELAIPFVLLGLAAKAPQYLGRVSMRTA